MLRSEPSWRSRESVALQRQVPPKRKNEQAGGCIYGLSLRLPATSDSAGMNAVGRHKEPLSMMAEEISLASQTKLIFERNVCHLT
jgi:hypothetical protein